MLIIFRTIFRVKTKYYTYQQKNINLKTIYRWLKQYPTNMYFNLLNLLNHTIYISEKETKKHLFDLNKKISERLKAAEILPNQIIYVQIDDAGSSSPVMLSILRDASNLTRKGSILIDSKNTKGLLEKTTELGQGAIIYVDDFAGSGRQFVKNRKWISDFIVGSFSEFFIAPCICEEAFQQIQNVGVEPVYSILHCIKDRPLHPGCKNKSKMNKNKLLKISKKINPDFPLGFDNLATMVIFYRNSPNSTPLILRGNLGQQPYHGIFPRHDDLPIC